MGELSWLAVALFELVSHPSSDKSPKAALD